MPTFDLRLLGAFSVVAEELHFGRAAALLGMAQPRLSQQVARLERQLGAELLDRRGGRVALTPVGVGVLAQSRAILQRADLVQAQLRHQQQSVLRVHLGDAVHPLVRAVAAAFTAGHPTTEVRFTRGSLSEAVQALADGRADVAFDLPGGTPPGMASAVLDGRHIGVACPPGHRLAGRPTADWADLDGESVLAPPPGVADAWDALIRAELHRAGVSCTFAVPRTNSYLCLGPDIAAGAVLLCAEHYHRRIPTALEWRPLLPERKVEIAVIWDDRNPSVAVRRFVEQAKVTAVSRARSAQRPVDAVGAA